MKKLFYLYILLLLVSSACSNFEKIRRSDDVDVRLEGAYKYYDEKEYYKAGILLDEVLPLLKGKESSEKANFYRALSYYHQKQYILSAYYFKDFYDTYPRSKHAEEALFMAAKSLYNESPRHNLDQSYSFDALRALQKFANRFPSSKYIEEANEITDLLNKRLEIKAFENAKLYYELGAYNSINYKSAVVAFNTFQRQYPASEFAAEAAWLQIDSQFRLALASVTSKQEERYLEAIEFYQNFVDKYPNSEYRKQAEEIYKKSLEKLENLKS